MQFFFILLRVFLAIKYSMILYGIDITIKVTNEQRILLLNIELLICILSSAIISRNVAMKYDNINTSSSMTYIRINIKQE